MHPLSFYNSFFVPVVRKGKQQTTTTRRKPNKRSGTKFGGRSTAIGVGYEAQVAAFIASKMLGGDGCVVWEGIDGDVVESITMQDAEPVDDVVMGLCGSVGHKIFISAKHRAGTIALTPKSQAFTEVVSSFVRQFRELTAEQRMGSRLMWAVPSSAGAGMTQSLRQALNAFREDVSVNMEDFLRRRSSAEKKAMKALLAQIELDLNAPTTGQPVEIEPDVLVGMIYVEVFDFGTNLHHDHAAQETIRNLVAAQPHDAGKIWDKLELHFNRADRQGLRTTAASLRQLLSSAGLKLKPTPGFAGDIEILQRLTNQNLGRLQDHTLLRFPTTTFHFERAEDLAAMMAAAKQGHLLVTGIPGCGKSGLIHPLAEALKKEGIPIVLLLAEEVFGRDWKAAASLSGLTHRLDDVLAHWADGAKGVLITDALDAVRNVDTQRELRHLLRSVQQGDSGWRVVASVREFDLKHGRELREAFPGGGVVGHSSNDFTGVSHFHVKGLDEAQLDELTSKVADIGPFIASARNNPRAGDMHRIPFFLRLASGLLSDGVSASRLADWSSPAVLLRRFWNTRVLDGGGASQRRVTLQLICSRMTELRAMTLAVQEVSLGASDLDAVNELRSRGILQSPHLHHGDTANDDLLSFSHHLLHDYAVARSLIPSVSARFAQFALSNPLLPIFYRQSFLFALEELWDDENGRGGFWECALKMESNPQLHGVTRIIAPVLAAKRVDSFSDLAPLLAAIESATVDDSPAEKALRHLAAGLQDADDVTLHRGTPAWCAFAARLSAILPGRPALETPVVHLLAKLNRVCKDLSLAARVDLNAAARDLLAHHVGKEVSKGWRYASSAAIEALCRTFEVAPSEAEVSLFSLLSPQRLAHFPSWDLLDLADSIKHLGTEGDNVVLRLFEAAFASEPLPGQWESFGGAILPMQMQSSDNWNSIHYALAEYYENRRGGHASLMAAAACITWNATVRRRHERSEPSKTLEIATFRFRDIDCVLVEDRGRVWGKDDGHEERRILSQFEVLLDEWSANGDQDSLNKALDCIAERNRTSVMWRVLLEVASKYPLLLGRELAPILSESLFLTHPDYSYGGILLFWRFAVTGG